MNISRKISKLKRRIPHIKNFFLPAAVVLITVFTTITLLTLFSTPRPPRLRIGSGDSLYTASNKNFSTTIGKKNGTPAILFSRGESQLGFVLAGSADTKPQKSNNSLLFPEAIPGIDLRYTTTTNGLKEELIVKQYNKDTSNIFLFDLNLNQIVPKHTTSNFIDPTFRDKDGNYLFHFEKPFAIDASGNRTDNVLLQIMEDKQLPGKYSMKLIVDENWLSSPTRSYPITIDPTIVHDTTTEFAAGTLNRVKDFGTGSNPRLESNYQPLPADKYTIGLWHMDESADNSCSGGQDACDLSGNGNHGTATGTTINTTTQKLGTGARTFNGSSDYLVTGSYNHVANTPVSAEAWIYLTSYGTGGSVILSHALNGSSGWPFFVGASSSSWGSTACQQKFGIYDGSAYRCSSRTVDLNQWHHVAFTFNGSQVVLYYDGVVDSTFTSSTMSGGNLAITMGGRWFASDSAGYFNGSLDEIRLSSIARSAEEIRANAMRRPSATYTSEVLDLGGASSFVTSWNPLTWTELGVATGDGETLSDATNLVAQWNLNETSGTTATNNAGSCGASCNGTLTGFASTASQDQAAGTGWTSANKRWGAGALMFDGASDYVLLPSTGASDTKGTALGYADTDDFTLELWYKGNDTGTGTSSLGKTLIGRDNADIYANFVLNGGYVEYLHYNGSWLHNIKSSTMVADGRWHHIAYVNHSNETGDLYIDGKKEINGQSSSLSSSTRYFKADNLMRGHSSQYTSGMLDSVRIYTRALIEPEILSNYQAGNIELQTRVGSDTSPDDGSWSAWSPTSGETSIDSFDFANSWNLGDGNANLSLNSTTGDGADGPLTPTGTFNLNSSVSGGRSYADGIAYEVSANPTNNTITTTDTPNGLAAGDEILLINLQGSSTDTLDVGNYEFLIISSVNIGTNTITTDSLIQKSYDGTLFSNQKVIIQRIPNYTNVTLDSSDSITASSWDGLTTTPTGSAGYSTGIVAMRANGTVTIGSGTTIDANNLGYRGSNAGTNGGQGGEAFCGVGGTGSPATGTPGGAGSAGGGGAGGSGVNNPTGNAGGSGYCGGGGGGGRGGNAGSGSSTKGGAGGGGGYVDNIAGQLGAGGGGGYGTAGSGGTGYGSNGASGGTNSSGNGGSNGGGGGGGGTYGNSNLSTLFFGSSGGEGGGNLSLSGSNGGNGGGIIYIAANTIYNSGTIRANGQNGTNGPVSYVGPGGGGAGGSILIHTNNTPPASSGVTVTGGSGGTQYEKVGGTGGSGIFKIAKISLPSTIIKQEGTSALEINSGKTESITNVVGLWHLDETGGTGAYLHDSTSNANHGTPTGTTLLDGINQKSRNFNGTSDYINTPDSSVWDFGSGNFTIEAWVKRSSTGTNDVIVGKDHSTTGARQFHMQITSANVVRIAYNTSDAAIAYLDTSATITDYKWHHIVGQRSGNSFNVYIDGALTSSGTTSGTHGTMQTTATDLRIGARQYTAAEDYFSGTIDEVKISNVARSAEEIAESYRMGRDHYINKTISSTDLSGKTSLPFYVAADRPGTYLQSIIGESSFANYQVDASTKGLWHLDEKSGSGAYLKDTSGSSNHLTPTGASSTIGKIGQNQSFNGSSNYLSSATITGLPTAQNARTFSAWIYPTNVNPGGVIMAENASSGQSFIFQISVSAGTTYLFTDGVNGANNITITGSQIPIANTWNHVAFIFNGTSTWTYYLNGSAVSTGTFGVTINTNPSTFSVGRRSDGANTGSYFPGRIDEARVDNIARTADEIRQAYEVGSRSHNITIDFAANLDSGNLISSGADLSFTVDATAYGLGSKGSMLFVGDKVIIRENYDGTEYIAQGIATSVTESTGAVTISAWDSGSTFPAGGYTTGATVFKWQREYWNIDGEVQDSSLDSITQLTLRLTDGLEGRSIYLDDLQSSAGYLTSPAGSAITSATGSRYMQYRAILSSWDEAVSATMSAVTLDYTINTEPDVPSLDAPTDTSTNQSLTPILETTGTDPDSDYLRYKIELCEDLGMSVSCQTFDQTSSQTNWSGQDAQTSTAYTSGAAAFYTITTPLADSTTYYWRSYAIDPAGTNTWSSTQATPFSFTTTAPPLSPSTPWTEGSVNPSGVTDLTPDFSAIHSDPDSDSAIFYELEVNTNNTFTGTVMWDTGSTSMTSLPSLSRSSDITYAGSSLSHATTYYWRIRFTDDLGATSPWSTTSSFTTNNYPATPTLTSPTNAATDQSLYPMLQTVSLDSDSDYLRYKIELCTNLGMTTGCQTFDQTSSQTNWSGQDAQTSTAYSSTTTASHTITTPLTAGITYYWRSYAIDPAGTNTWSSTQATPFSFTTIAYLPEVLDCRIDESNDKTSFNVSWTDRSTDEDGYEIQRSINGGAWSVLATSLAANTTSYLDSPISAASTYSYRIAAYRSPGVDSFTRWCTTSTLLPNTSTFKLN